MSGLSCSRTENLLVHDLVFVLLRGQKWVLYKSVLLQLYMGITRIIASVVCEELIKYAVELFR